MTYDVLKYPGSSLPEEYVSLVYSKWLRSYRFGNEYFKLIQSDVYFSVYHQYIESVLKRPDTTVKLAVVSDDYDTVLGFSVHQGDCLHYVHVHRDQRRHGIGRTLAGDFQTFSHLTQAALPLWSKYYSQATFNPFI